MRIFYVLSVILGFYVLPDLRVDASSIKEIDNFTSSSSSSNSAGAFAEINTNVDLETKNKDKKRTLEESEPEKSSVKNKKVSKIVTPDKLPEDKLEVPKTVIKSTKGCSKNKNKNQIEFNSVTFDAAYASASETSKANLVFDNLMANRQNLNILTEILSKSSITYISRSQQELLLELTISDGCEFNVKALLDYGFRLNLNPPPESTIEAFLKSLKMKKLSNCKVEFLLSMLTYDPIGTLNLLIAAKEQSKDTKTIKCFIKIFENMFKISQENENYVFDSETIRLAAETAASKQSYEFLSKIFESNLLKHTISDNNLMILFSKKEEKIPKDLFLRILHHQAPLNTAISNFFIYAADTNNTDFLIGILDFLSEFSMDSIISGLEKAINSKFFNFANILLSTTKYKSYYRKSFGLVSEAQFASTIGKHCTSEIFEKILYLRVTNFVLSPEIITKIYINAAIFGNIDIVEYLLNNQFFFPEQLFNISTLTEVNNSLGLSILNIALKSKSYTLAKYLIKNFDFDIRFSHRYNINTNGDALNYVVDSNNVSMFQYLLNIGADPDTKYCCINVVDGKYSSIFINLVYWCIFQNYNELVELLLFFNCKIDFNLARHYNSKNTDLKISKILDAAAIKRNEYKNETI